MKHNLIGISGKIDSGKDLIGSILQWIATSKTGFGNGTYSNEECVEWLNGKYPGDTSIQKISGYQIKKFADKLKDIVCLLIGCTREQLEDRNFKEKPLGEEWVKYRIITKDLPNYYVSTLEEAENHVRHKNQRYVKVNLTFRLLLQLLGTECGREILHPNIWVNALFADYKATNVKSYINKFGEEEVVDMDLPNWIMTDVRFPNEVKAIKDRGGVVIRVNRDSDVVDDHPSETSLNDYEFDYVIENKGSIEDLIEKVKQLNLV